MLGPSELETPERGMVLENREAEPQEKPGKKREAELKAARDEATTLRRDLDEVTKRLRALKGGIEAARKVRPQGSELHCARCFGSGRDAALRVIEGK